MLSRRSLGPTKSAVVFGRLQRPPPRARRRSSGVDARPDPPAGPLRQPHQPGARADDDHDRRRHRPPRRRTDRPHAERPTLTTTTGMLTFGHLAWLFWTWVVRRSCLRRRHHGVARWGIVDQSLWQSVAAGWQRYVVFGAGVTTTTTFLRMLVRNGVTAGPSSSASTVVDGRHRRARRGCGSSPATSSRSWSTTTTAGRRRSTATPCSSGPTCRASRSRRARPRRLLHLRLDRRRRLLPLRRRRRHPPAAPGLVPAALLELFASRDFGGDRPRRLGVVAGPSAPGRHAGRWARPCSPPTRGSPAGSRGRPPCTDGGRRSRTPGWRGVVRGEGSARRGEHRRGAPADRRPRARPDAQQLVVGDLQRLGVHDDRAAAVRPAGPALSIACVADGSGRAWRRRHS